MHYEGMGLDKNWTITYTTKTKRKVYDIWKIFCYILSDMHCWRDDLCVRMYIGSGHLFLKSRHNPGSGGVTVDRLQIEQLLNHRTVTDTYVKKIGACFDAFSKQMNGKHVRLYTLMSEFCLISTEYFDYLKSINQEKYVGLYADRSGFCRTSFLQQRNVCKVGKSNQCIFVKTLFENNEKGQLVKRYACGKFSQIFATQRHAEFDNGLHQTMIVGTCESLRGFEI